MELVAWAGQGFLHLGGELLHTMLLLTYEVALSGDWIMEVSRIHCILVLVKHSVRNQDWGWMYVCKLVFIQNTGKDIRTTTVIIQETGND